MNLDVEKKIKDFKLSYSSLKDFEDPSICIESWFRKWVIKDNRKEATKPMQRGNYFETIAMQDYGKKSRPLWEAPDGDTSVITKRIKEKAEIASSYFNKDSKNFQGINITDTDVLIELTDTKGVLDILGKDEDENTCVVDLKLTANSENNFGYVNWNSDNLDATQLLFYRCLLQGKYPDIKDNVRLFYFVFDYAPANNQPIIIEKQYDDFMVQALIDRVETFFSFFDGADWGYYDEVRYNPTAKNCGDCIIDCPYRITSDTPKRKII